MDFLLLFSDRQRVVIEVDGKQHYADGDHPSPSRYSAMVAEDRRLRLAGYEVPVFWPPVWGAPRQGCKRTDGFDATGRMGALGGGWLLPRCVACRV